MKTGMSSVLLWVSVIMCIPACSVKEDRGECPCRIVFDLSGIGDAADSVCLSLVSTDGFLLNTALPLGNESSCHSFDVRKGLYLSNIYCGGQGFFSDSNGIIIPEGEQCPAVYMFSERIEAYGEYCFSRPVLSKNYCLARILLVCDDAAELPFSLRIRGNVDGYGLSGEPSDGKFSFVPEIGKDGRSEVRLPRQKDASLKLDVVEDDRILRTFALGSIIIESGYDWSARNLEDIELTVDYSKTDVTFIVNGWEKEFTFDITI